MGLGLDVAQRTSSRVAAPVERTQTDELNRSLLSACRELPMHMLGPAATAAASAPAEGDDEEEIGGSFDGR